MPTPPTNAGRTTGTCTTRENGGGESLIILSGMGGAMGVSQLTMTLDGGAPQWSWRRLPNLPGHSAVNGPQKDRWLGAAGVVDGWLVLAGGTTTRGFEYEETGLLHAGDGATRPCNKAADCPPWLPSFRLPMAQLGNRSAQWSEMAKFPGGGMDVPNYAAVNGSLYMFGGWRASYAGMQAWQETPDSLYQLGLPVPITIGTNGARLLRYAWRYSADDAWERLPDVPQHVCSGGTVTLRSRYIVQLGSAHGYNSFRVGSRSKVATDPPAGMGWRHDVQPPNNSTMPEFALQQHGIAAYYGDQVLVFDTQTRRYSRVGVVPYGLITSHCVANDTTIACALGEPRHGWSANTETVVQIASINWRGE